MMDWEKETDGDRLIRDTYTRNARLEKILRRAALPATLLGAAAGAALVVFGLGPFFVAGAAQTLTGLSIVAGVVGAGAAFGTIDKYADRFGLRNLALGSMMAMRGLKRVEAQIQYHTPLDKSATKAFIKALADGVKEKLHIGKPLTFKNRAQSGPAQN